MIILVPADVVFKKITWSQMLATTNLTKPFEEKRMFEIL